MKSLGSVVIVALSLAAATSAYASLQQASAEHTPNGLGLLLDTPRSPVGDIFQDRNSFT
ncbi:MAG: hypothetical protein OXR62_15730 [Ahrensia sp.]|nr:hypothetical protein [Ahrensia sp.]